MIYDSVQNLETYCDQDDAIALAVDFVQNFDTSKPDGRYEIYGDDMFALIQTITTSDPSEKAFEAHENYIDVQMVLDGIERHDLALLDLDQLSVSQDYDSDKDIIFFNTPTHFSTLIMKPGNFVVYGPTDVHRPGCAVNTPQKIRKVCVKIKIEFENEND